MNMRGMVKMLKPWLTISKLLLLLLLAALPAAAESCPALMQSAPERAITVAQMQLRATPTDQAARGCLAGALFFAGAFIEAAAEYERLAQGTAATAPKAVAWSKAGWAWLRADAAGRAGKAFAAAIKLQPKVVQHWHDHATALMQAEQYWDAQRELDHALSLAPQDAAIWAARAECWYQLGSMAKARGDARQALALQPGQPLALTIAAKTQRDDE